MSVKFKKHSGQCRMSNLLRKLSRITALFLEKLAEKKLQKLTLHASQLKCSIDYCKNNSLIQKTELKNTPFEF